MTGQQKTRVPRRPPKDKYDDEIWGTFGEIGNEINGVRFIQTVLTVQSLDKLTLVCDLPGSEKWPVRQLFQREIDIPRVTDEIIPYFLRADKMKYFNPLTIAALPLNEKHQVVDILKEQPIEPDPRIGTSDDWQSFESDGFYKITHEVVDDGNLAKFEWSRDNVKLVAIDGQHRLSSLKRIYDDWKRNPDNKKIKSTNFSKWQIPIIIILAPANGKAKKLSLLEKTRDIFVTINKQAKTPTRCRTIILDDYTITSICCQETLEVCHEDEDKNLPLIFFDWRAGNHSDKPENPLSFLRVEELEDLLINYLLGSDNDAPEKLSEDQRLALSIDDMAPPLADGDSIEMRKQIRAQYRETVLPAIVYIFKNFIPFKGYVDFLRRIIEDCSKGTDIQRHAWSKLMFGVHQGQDALRDQIEKEVQKIIGKANIAKESIDGTFNRLVGQRAVFAGFAQYAESYINLKSIVSWEVLATSYIKHINDGFSNGLFNSNEKSIRHLCFDQNESVVNYKHDQVENALGCYMALVALTKENIKGDKVNDEVFEYFETIRKTINNGYKREVRPLIKEENPQDDRKTINTKVESKAKSKTTTQIKSIKKKLGLKDD